MKENNKLPILTFATHSSTGRPTGHNFLIKKLKSIIEVKDLLREVVIIDNQSTPPVSERECYKEFVKHVKTTLIRVDDQTLKGVSGAWNLGIKTSFNLGAEYVINSCDDCVMNNSLKNYISWHLKNNSNPYICGPITDDFGTGVKLQKLSNTKLGNFQKVAPENNPHELLDENAKKIWRNADRIGQEAIDAEQHLLPDFRPQPWMNAFCFAMNKQAYDKIIESRKGHEDALFSVGYASKKNIDDFGVVKSKWGGHEYSFEHWKTNLKIDLKIIGSWYVAHFKDTSGNWRRLQAIEKSKVRL